MTLAMKRLRSRSGGDGPLTHTHACWVAPEPTHEKKTQLSPEKGPERLLTASGSSSNKEGNLLTTVTLTEGNRGSTVPGPRDQPG